MTVDVLGVRVSGWTRDELLAHVLNVATLSEGPLQTICYANIHVLNSAYDQPKLREALQSASTIYCDGSGARLGAALMGVTLPARVTAADLIGELSARAAERGAAVFLLGGAPGVAASAARVLQSQYSSLKVAGTHHGYLTEATDAGVIDAINASGADILLVGMGTPTQELWVARHRAVLKPRVVWVVGALLDFVAGIERRGPSWMVDNHLEWLARLWANPRRMWKRYLLGNPRFIARVLKDRWSRSPTSEGHHRLS